MKKFNLGIRGQEKTNELVAAARERRFVIGSKRRTKIISAPTAVAQEHRFVIGIPNCGFRKQNANTAKS